MAAISLVPRDGVSQLVKRGNWASQEAGVVTVFCIIFVVAVGLIGIWIHKWMVRKRAAKQQA